MTPKSETASPRPQVRRLQGTAELPRKPLSNAYNIDGVTHGNTILHTHSRRQRLQSDTRTGVWNLGTRSLEVGRC